MKRRSLMMAPLILICAEAALRAQHADIRPYVEDGRIHTDGYIDDTMETVSGLRVFGYDFGEEPSDPFFAAEPGINAAAGSGLPVGSQLLFRVPNASLFGLPSNLGYWEGADADPLAAGTQVAFRQPPGSEAVRLNLGSHDLLVGSDLGEIAGFALGTVDSSGALHDHLSAFLENAGLGDPAGGIYLVVLEFLSSDPLVGSSEPVFIVYNHGLKEELHDLAMDWVAENLATVPEPSTMLSAVIAVCLLSAASWSIPRRRCGGGCSR